MMTKNIEKNPVSKNRLYKLGELKKRTFLWLIIVGSVLALAYFGSIAARSMMVAKGAHELRTEHFVLFYQGIREKEAGDVANHLEQNYARILEELGVPDQDVVYGYIHSSQDAFNDATGLAGSSAIGTSRGPSEFHIIWTNWHNSIFPANPLKNAVHEFTHCVQLNILISEALESWDGADPESFNAEFEDRFSRDYPQWLWEAISIYQAKEVNSLSVNYGMWTDPDLQSLNNSPQVYNVGYTLIEYIVETWGKEKIPMLIRSYGDLETVLDIDEKSFEDKWKMFVKENY